MRVLTVSAENAFLQEIWALLENAEDITVITGQSGLESVNLLPDLQPDLILLDLDTVTSNASDVVTKISEQHPDIKIVVLSTAGQEASVLDALRSGAQGHLVKGPHNGDELITALHTVNRGDSILSPAIAGVILDEISYRSQLIRSAHSVADSES
jgi:DNA-binding NarL/FixJ family response regulator